MAQLSFRMRPNAPGEVARIRWRDVKPRERVIEIPDAKKDNTIRIIMSAPIARVLKRARNLGRDLGKPKDKDAFVFEHCGHAWGGFTRFADSPFPLDMPGRPVDIVKLDLPSFQHAVRMELGGIAGEHVLYDGEIPAASSLDERILSQHACEMRARGNTEIAKITWRDLFKETCSTIEQNRETAGELIAAFENKDRLEGPELQEVLNKRRLH